MVKSHGLYKRGVSDYILDTITAVVMIFVTIICLYPFLYILFYSLSNVSMVGGKVLLYPVGFNIDAYKLMFTSVSGIKRAFFISVARSVIGPALSVIIIAMGAYAMTRQKLVFRGFIMKYVTATMYFSSSMIPTYLLMHNLKLTGTFWIYILPTLFSVFYMILVKTYMESLPTSLEESAAIDGASEYVTFFKLILPMCKPVLAAVILFECVGQWNRYSDTLLYNAGNKNLHTMQYVLMSFIQTNSSNVEEARENAAMNNIDSATLRMALTMITIVPILCVYPFLQKYFASGILIGSIKG